MEVVIIILFGSVALIFLVDVLGDVVAAVRRHFTPAEALESPTYSAGFSLRRPDSALRKHYHHKIRPHGRTSEIYNYKDDPYDV